MRFILEKGDDAMLHRCRESAHGRGGNNFYMMDEQGCSFRGTWSAQYMTLVFCNCRTCCATGHRTNCSFHVLENLFYFILLLKIGFSLEVKSSAAQ